MEMPIENWPLVLENVIKNILEDRLFIGEKPLVIKGFDLHYFWFLGDLRRYFMEKNDDFNFLKKIPIEKRLKFPRRYQ